MTRLVLALVVIALASGRATAHDLRPGVVSLTEQAPGDYALHFAPPIDARGDVTDVTLELPASCTRSETRVRCDGPIAGELAVLGMRGAAMKTIIVLERDAHRDE